MKNEADLKAALNSSAVGTVKLSESFTLTEPLTVNRVVNLDLGGKNLTGNIKFDTTQPGTINLSNGTLTGNLTIDTKNASFVNNATVTGTTTITNVAPATFTNKGTLGAVTIDDADGTRFVNSGVLGAVTIATNGNVTLGGALGTVNVTGEANITNQGTIADFNAQSAITLFNNGTVTDLTGTGAVALSGTGDVTKATNTNVVVAIAGAPNQELTKSGELVAVVEGKLGATFSWSSENGVGTKLVEKSGRYNYFNDGAYLDITVGAGAGNVAFNDVFDAMTLQTDGGPIDAIKGDAGRQLEDWNGTDGAWRTKLKTAESKAVFYGVRQSGQSTDLGKTRTVGFNAGDSRTIVLTVTPKEDLAPGTYTITIQPKQQTGVTSGDNLGAAITYEFEISAPVAD